MGKPNLRLLVFLVGRLFKELRHSAGTCQALFSSTCPAYILLEL